MKTTPFDYSMRIGRLTPVIQSRKRPLRGPPQAWLALGVFLAGIGIGLGQPVITQQPQSCTNIAGTTASFTVTATGTMPMAYQWQWSFDLANYVDQPEGTNSTLVINHVQTADWGNYRVIVTNVDGTITSTVATLTVLLPPTNVKVTPTNSSVSLGANLTLRVTTSGSTPFSYQWCKGGMPLSDGGNLSGSQTATLVLTNVLGAAYTIRATLPALTESAGHLLLTSSVAGRRALAGSLYSATKFAVSAMGESLRQEVDGAIRVTLIEPGMVNTPFFDNEPENALQPADIARGVIFALSQPKHVDVNEILIRPTAQPS